MLLTGLAPSAGRPTGTSVDHDELAANPLWWPESAAVYGLSLGRSCGVPALASGQQPLDQLKVASKVPRTQEVVGHPGAGGDADPLRTLRLREQPDDRSSELA